MSFFDFFFPEQAQASHLRTIAENQRYVARRESNQRFDEEMRRRQDRQATAAMEDRVAALEKDLGQAGLIIEALVQLLGESGTLQREDLMQRAIEVDLADGLNDGKLTPPEEANRSKPFVPHRKWGQAQE